MYIYVCVCVCVGVLRVRGLVGDVYINTLFLSVSHRRPETDDRPIEYLLISARLFNRERTV